MSRIAFAFCAAILLLTVLPHPAPGQTTPAQNAARPAADLQKSFAEINKELAEQLGPILEQQAEPQAPQVPQIPEMFNDYVTVLAFLKKADNATRENVARIQELCTDYMPACHFVGEFWRVRALKDCAAFNAYAVDRLLPQEADPVQEAYVTGMLGQCAYGYYYDHWNEINESVQTALENARKAGVISTPRVKTP